MKKQPRLEPLPALSAYQEQLHHDIHGPAEPLPPNLARKTKTGSVQPLKDAVSPLPPLPMDLEYRQRTMEGETSSCMTKVLHRVVFVFLYSST